MSSLIRRIERRILVEKGRGMRITELNPDLSHRQAQRGRGYASTEQGEG